MAKKEERLYTTGEVAKIFSINKNTLFYYDKIGLFSPNYRKGNTNYRYYGSDQMKILDTIISLRAMGIPIRKLKEFINNMNTNSFLDLIELENQHLRSIIDEYSIKMKTIQELSRRIKVAQEAIPNQLIITREEHRYFLAMNIDKTCNDPELAWNGAYEKIWDTIDTAKIITIGSSLKRNEFDNGQFDRLDKVVGYTILKTKDKLEKGVYANIYIHGSYDRLDDGYSLFRKLLRENGLNVISDIHEEYVIEAMSEKNEENYTTHLFALVDKVDE